MSDRKWATSQVFFLLAAVVICGLFAVMKQTSIIRAERPAPIYIEFEQEEIITGVSCQITLQPTVYSHDDLPADLTYFSSDESIATVDQLGVVQAIAPGKCLITVRTVNGLEASVTIDVRQLPQQIILNTDHYDLLSGDMVTLYVTMLPQGSYSPLTFSSSDKNIALAYSDATIYGDQAGKCDVTVSAVNGVKAVCHITVRNKPESLSFSEKNVYLILGEKYRQSARITGENVDSSLHFFSSNPKVATVDDNGNITTKAIGSTVITAMGRSGIKASYNLNVKTTHISVAVTSVPLMVGKHFRTYATIKSSNPNVSITYSSSNKTVATVDEKGIIYGVGIGTATIFARSSDEKDVVRINVEVSDRYIAQGIDISRWQGNISQENFNKIKADGMDFVIIRIAYSSVESGFMDNSFLANYQRAKKAGLMVGGYHYVTCTDHDKAVEEAESLLYYLSLRDFQFEYPIWMDFEDKPQMQLPVSEQNDLIDTYCSIVRQAGYEVNLYASASAVRKYDQQMLRKYGPNGIPGIALAQWSTLNPNKNYKGQFVSWQFTSDGRVDGIRGRVDMNLFSFDYPAYIRENHLNGY